ncbi:coiled-coil domain-containing protein [Pyrococcus yayanosii]|uniref:Uncharacterized protein n=1 Tax=Pyrococcus yayanosii (strain CH1 / JCM 16557) TaxID=529709 RepID=F8AGE6_PYRYC|nr:hypothetical protein [Pyrococcus yayanosii]AEH25142.1 hypothetical protein PYCH_14720 [Pyrococcus yayanosii CH1]
MKWKPLFAVLLGLLVVWTTFKLDATDIVYSKPSIQTLLTFQNRYNGTSTCTNFDPDIALYEINMTVQKITLDINQKENLLRRLSKEVRTTRDFQLLKEIVELHREIEVLKSKRAFYQRKGQSIRLYKQYLNGEYMGLTSEELKGYKDKIPNPEDVKTPKDVVTKLSIMGEMTFDKIVLIDNEINEILENTTNSKNATEEVVNRIFLLINNQSILWNQLREYAALRDDLQTKSLLSNSNSLAISGAGNHNCQLKSNGKINCREIQRGYYEDFECCLSFYRILSPLKSYQTYTFVGLTPVAVWVGMYSSEFPNVDYHIGDWCTYTFPPDNRESTIRDIYWETAREIGRNWGLNVKSIQIKFFYSARVYRQETRKYEETNLIFQYDCYFSGESVRCLPSPAYRKSLFADPQSPPYRYTTKIVTNPYWLVCKSGGNCNGYGCQYAKWANAHCGGCFAPDKSASQYFAKS